MCGANCVPTKSSCKWSNYTWMKSLCDPGCHSNTIAVWIWLFNYEKEVATVVLCDGGICLVCDNVAALVYFFFQVWIRRHISVKRPQFTYVLNHNLLYLSAELWIPAVPAFLLTILSPKCKESLLAVTKPNKVPLTRKSPLDTVCRQQH